MNKTDLFKDDYNDVALLFKRLNLLITFLSLSAPPQSLFSPSLPFISFPARFMPEPNLPPLFVYESVATVPDGVDPAHVVVIDRLKAQLPELPGAKRTRLMEEYGILPEHSFTLVVRQKDRPTDRQ